MEMTPRAPKVFGYSGTPLVRKLGIKPDSRIVFISPPKNFSGLLGPLPKTAVLSRDGSLDFAILFVKSRRELVKDFAKLRDRLEPDGMVWVAWPKRTSGVPTDLVEGIVREFGLESGLVDVKVCAIDNTWSGLKFVRRLADR
jgi:hypothetical protein